jgi:hypothetical protein
MACATGGKGGGAKGVGATIVAPGEPVPGASGVVTAACGEMRLRGCADAHAGANRIIPPAATAAAAQRQNAFRPRPDITIFLELNHGNFMLPFLQPGSS